MQFATPTGVAVIDAAVDSIPLVRSLLGAEACRLLGLHAAGDGEALLQAAGLPYLIAATPAAAAAGAGIYLGRDDLSVIAAQGVTTDVLGGTNPVAGLARALSALEFGRDVREANPGTAALVGPWLQRRAADSGADYRIEGQSRLGREAAFVQRARPTIIRPGGDIDALAAAAVLAGMFDYRLTEHAGVQLLVQPGAALPDSLPAEPSRTAFSCALPPAGATPLGDGWYTCNDDGVPPAQPFPPLRRVLELVTQITAYQAPTDDAPEHLDLQPRLVSAADADRDGLVPWPTRNWPLRAPVSAGALLRWDDLLYQATDPTVRIVLLQRRLIAATEAS